MLDRSLQKKLRNAHTAYTANPKFENEAKCLKHNVNVMANLCKNEICELI